VRERQRAERERRERGQDCECGQRRDGSGDGSGEPVGAKFDVEDAAAFAEDAEDSHVAAVGTELLAILPSLPVLPSRAAGRVVQVDQCTALRRGLCKHTQQQKHQREQNRGGSHCEYVLVSFQ